MQVAETDASIFKQPSESLLVSNRTDNSQYQRLDSEGNSVFTQASEENSQSNLIDEGSSQLSSLRDDNSQSTMSVGDNSQSQPESFSDIKVIRK